MTGAPGGDDSTVIRGSHYWWIPAIAGVVLIAGGIAVAAWPGRSVRLVTFLGGVLLIVNGLLEVSTALMLRRRIDGWAYYLASGIWSVAFGVPLALLPELSARALATLLGVFLLLGGTLGIGVGAAIRRRGGRSGHYLARGIVGMAVGLAAIAWPGMTLGVIAFVFAVWLVMVGMLLIVASAGIAQTTVVVSEE